MTDNGKNRISERMIAVGIAELATGIEGKKTLEHTACRVWLAMEAIRSATDTANGIKAITNEIVAGRLSPNEARRVFGLDPI